MQHQLRELTVELGIYMLATSACGELLLKFSALGLEGRNFCARANYSQVSRNMGIATCLTLLSPAVSPPFNGLVPTSAVCQDAS